MIAVATAAIPIQKIGVGLTTQYQEETTIPIAVTLKKFIRFFPEYLQYGINILCPVNPSRRAFTADSYCETFNGNV